MEEKYEIIAKYLLKLLLESEPPSTMRRLRNGLGCNIRALQ